MQSEPCFSLNPSHWERIKIANHEKTDKKICHKEEIDKSFIQGYEKGRKEGNSTREKESLENGMEILKAQNTLLDMIARGINEKKLMLHLSIHDECLNIIRHLAYSILKSELTAKPDRLRLAIDEAFHLLNPRASVSLHLHPDICERLSSLFVRDDISVVPDPELSPEDFYLTHGYSKLDGCLKTQVERALSSMFDQV